MCHTLNFNLMKKKLLILSMLLSVLCYGQTVTKERKVVQLISPQNIYLNGGNKATFLGGTSRTWVPITLPPNTVEWYYSFSTTIGKSPNASIDIFSQLTRFLDPTGATAILSSLIMTPEGTAYCDTKLMNRKNADAFTQKVDLAGGTYLYQISGSRDNYKQGTVQIKDVTSGNWCLGFRNPSMTQGISINFEVVAIVEETRITEKTESEQKAEMLGSMGWKCYEKGDYKKCMELSKKALEINPNMGWVHSNIGLVQLLENDYVAAIDSYSKAIVNYKKTSNPKAFFSESIKDLQNMVASQGAVEGSTEILEMLQVEYNKY
jgi:tetratricopeptide (TPR) repeat protein